jgi:hypothetical protein
LQKSGHDDWGNRPQLPKYVVEAITSVETRLTLPLEMGRKVYQQTRGASRHFKKLGPKSFPNTQMKVESKEVSWH